MKNNLKGYRNMLGLSQTEMCVKIGIGLTSYCMKEQGKRDFNQTEMENIVEVFREEDSNLTMDILFKRKKCQSEEKCKNE